MNQLLPEEKRKRVTELRAELAQLRTSVKSGGTVDNPARIRELRRTIARLLTTLNQNSGRSLHNFGLQSNLAEPLTTPLGYENSDEP